MENKLIKYEQENYLKVVVHRDEDILTYSATLSFHDIAQLFVPTKLTETTLDENCGNDIINYILNNQDRFALSDITVVTSKQLLFKTELEGEAFYNPLDHTDFSFIVGYIKINENTKFNIIDGIKRIQAINKIVNNSLMSLNNMCTVSVDIQVQDSVE